MHVRGSGNFQKVIDLQESVGYAIIEGLNDRRVKMPFSKLVDMVRAVPRGVPLVGLGHLVTDLSQGALLVALPYFKTKFGLSYAEVSAIALMQNLTSSVIQPVFGYWSDRNPRPWLMAAGCALSGMSMLASFLVNSYWLLLVCTALTGLGIAAFHPEGAKTVNRLSGAAKGKAVSMFVVGGTPVLH